MLAHTDVVKPPVLTVHAMEAANARARRLGEAPIFARVRRKTTSGSYVYRWVRIARSTPAQTAVGGAIGDPSNTASSAPAASPPAVIVGGLESGTPVR